ncbi:MAG: DUF929 family protein [Candidatus Dormibacteria bacterium]
MAAITRPSPTVLAAVGGGGLTDPLQVLPGAAPLNGPGGKPQLLYVGADYCPFCAAERWSLIAALSRFGEWSGLHLMTSSSTDVYPDTSTFTFAGSSFTSSQLSFAAVETETRDRQPLQALTPAQQQVFSTYDAPPYTSTRGGIPFLDFGGRYVSISSGFTPEVLTGMSWQQVADTVGSSSAPQARAILGNANWITAGLCRMTGDQPGSVCSTETIHALELRLPAAAGR